MATYTVKAAGEDYTVEVEDLASGGARVEVDGHSFDVSLVSVEGAAERPAASVVPVQSTPGAPLASTPSAVPAPAGSGSIVAPIPGLIVKVCVAVGDRVSANQVLLKLEAMKMENDILSPIDGSVKQIAAKEGDEVSDGELLLVIE